MRRNWLVHVVQGAIIGVANVIPGVSGGTMALVVGIYDRLISAISGFNLETIRSFFGAIRSDRRGARLLAWARDHDLFFLALLGLGAIAAVLVSSRAIEHLIVHHYQDTYGFFFGLVAASIVVPYALLRKRSWPQLVAAIVAALLTISIAEMKSPEAKLRAAEQKEAIRLAQDDSADARDSNGDDSRSMSRYAFLTFVGAIAISAMILPGISGSFILLLFGAYFDVIRAVNERDFLVLAFFAAGCCIGIILFVKLLDFLLKRCYSTTLAFLTGLMVGSLWILWPFKERIEYVGGKPVPFTNVFPDQYDVSVGWTLGSMALGMALVLAFFAFDRAKAKRSAVRADAS